MDENDFIDILSYLREQVRKVGLSNLDEIATVEATTLENPKSRLEVYLNMTINMLIERSSSQAFHIYERFSQTLEVEGGSGFNNVIVELSDVDRETYGLDGYAIDEVDDYSHIIFELKKILEEIKMEPEPPNSHNNRGPGM